MKERIKRGKEKIKIIRKEIKEEVIFNVPNTITLMRLILGFFVVYMIFSGFSRLTIALVFAFAAITDFFDGYLARKLKQTTSIGARLDQVADRVFTITIVVALLFYFILYTHEKVIFLFLIMSREIVALPGFLIRMVRDKSAYKVRYIGKLMTFVQSIAVGLLILGVSWIIYPVMITSIIGIIAGLDYLKDSIS